MWSSSVSMTDSLCSDSQTYRGRSFIFLLALYVSLITSVPRCFCCQQTLHMTLTFSVSWQLFIFFFQGPIEFVNCPQLLSLWTHVQDLQILLFLTYFAWTSICTSLFQLFCPHWNLASSLVSVWWLSPPFSGFPTPSVVLGMTRPHSVFTLRAPCSIASSSDSLPSPEGPQFLVSCHLSFRLVSSFSYHILFALLATPLRPFFQPFHCPHQLTGILCSPLPTPAPGQAYTNSQNRFNSPCVAHAVVWRFRRDTIIES